jgi:hypothetical protein
MLPKYVAQVFYVPDTTNKRLNVVIPEKWWIIEVENAVDEEEFDQFDEIPPFTTSMINPRIPSSNELRKNQEFQKSKTAIKSSKMIVCKICSLCENMVICVEIWLSLDICVNYAQCVKIWPFVWKFDFHLIFEWKYGRFWSVCSFWSLMFNSDGHYSESGNCSISDEEKGRRAPATRVSRLIKWRRVLWRCVSPLLHMQKRIHTDYSPQDSTCTNRQHDIWHTYANVCVLMVTLQAQHKKHRVKHMLCDIFKALRLSWV